MLVCHCKKKTDRDIRAAAATGARSSDEIARRCEAGSACGGCRSMIDALLQTSRGPSTLPAAARRA